MPIKIELPEGFLDEEVRCGYTVSAEMKKLWAVELDLLVEFDRVCKKNNLTYFVEAGTLLGAIRHKGFIPWDDDIDVGMFREDYERLSQIADQEFQHPYFFQTPFSDPGLVMGGSRLRNSNTAVLNDMEYRRSYKNKGIFIDIFALDNVPDNDLWLGSIKLVLKYYWRILRYAAYYGCYFEEGKEYSLKRRLAGKISLMLKQIFGMKQLYRGYEKICSKYSNLDTAQVAYIEFLRGRDICPGEWYKNVLFAPFEHLQVPIPYAYDNILSLAYGDYMVMKKAPSVHRPFTFDAETSYTEYYK